jgi:hypothetical protein
MINNTPVSLVKSLGRLRWLQAALALGITSSAQAQGNGYGTWPHALRNTAAIGEADVTGLSYTYDTHRGPRTVATLTNMTCHRGALPAYDKLELSTMGGPLPSGGVPGGLAYAAVRRRLACARVPDEQAVAREPGLR